MQTRQERRLHHAKRAQDKAKFGVPSPKDVKEGSLVVRFTSDYGLVIITKYNGELYYTSLDKL